MRPSLFQSVVLVLMLEVIGLAAIVGFIVVVGFLAGAAR